MKQIILAAALAASIPGAAIASPIIVGQTTDLSSVAGQQMKEFNQGASLVFDQINKTGGINGRQIKLVTKDDAFAADKAKANAEQLVKEGAVVLFGARGTDPAEAVLAVAEASAVPLVAPVTGAETLRRSAMVFPVRASYEAETDGMLRIIAEHSSTLAVLVQQDKFGKPLAEYVKKRLADYPKLRLVAEVPFDRKQTDLSAEAGKVLETKAFAVIALCNPTSCGNFASEIHKQAAAGRMGKPIVYQTSISDVYAQQKKIGADALVGQPFSQVLPDPNDITIKLSKDFQRAGGGSYRAYEGYTSALVLVEGLKRAKTLDPVGIRAGLESIGKLDLGGVTLLYHHGNHRGLDYVDQVLVSRSGRLIH